MLYIIGLGLYDEKDVTVRGLECIQQADIIYLESYTSILLCNKKTLSAFYNKEVVCASRKDVEEEGRQIINSAKTKIVAFLVVGDPFCATTHADLVLRAIEDGIDFRVIHNASIMNGIAECGLQLYSFGETVSIPFFQGSWRPSSFYDKIAKNMNNGLHTLCLLDIKVKEQTLENLMKANDVYEPPRFMTVNEAVEQLLEIEGIRNKNICVSTTKAFGVARLGSFDAQLIRAGTLEELSKADFGPPLHSLVICAPELHDMETKFFNFYSKA